MIRVVHPGSGCWLLPIPDPGSRGLKGTGSRIRIRNTACNFLSFSLFFCQMFQNFSILASKFNFLGKKMLFSNCFICLEFIPIRIGRTRPDLDPDQQHCSIMDGMIVHCDESRSQNIKNLCSKKDDQIGIDNLWSNSSAIYYEQGLRHITVKHWYSHVWLTQGFWCVSGEQLPAVNTWVKLIEIKLLICTMATVPLIWPSDGAGQGVRVCAPLPGVSQVWERKGRSPLQRL